MELLNFEGQDVLDSRDVAEMISKDHKHLMRDIRLYTKDLEDSPKLDPHQFFIPSTYTISKEKYYLIISSLNRAVSSWPIR